MYRSLTDTSSASMEWIRPQRDKQSGNTGMKSGIENILPPQHLRGVKAEITSPTKAKLKEKKQQFATENDQGPLPLQQPLAARSDHEQGCLSFPLFIINAFQPCLSAWKFHRQLEHCAEGMRVMSWSQESFLHCRVSPAEQPCQLLCLCHTGPLTFTVPHHTP